MLIIDVIHPFAQFVLPENIAHAFLTVLFLVSGQWIAFLLNAPLLVFNANKYVARPLHHSDRDCTAHLAK